MIKKRIEFSRRIAMVTTLATNLPGLQNSLGPRAIRRQSGKDSSCWDGKSRAKDMSHYFFLIAYR